MAVTSLIVMYTSYLRLFPVFFSLLSQGGRSWSPSCQGDDNAQPHRVLLGITQCGRLLYVHSYFTLASSQCFSLLDTCLFIYFFAYRPSPD